MRKVYLLPNIVTTGNMFFGFYSIVSAIHYDFLGAAWAIVIAGVFDMLDGRVARMTHTTSQFGVEYDSMSDLISFGMAPSILIYLWALEPMGRMGWLVAFLFLACAALRLARFNIFSSVYSKSFFMGLPSPVAAGLIASFALFRSEVQWPDDDVFRFFILGLSLGLGALMVSTVPFPSFKELNWKNRFSFGYLLIGLMVLVLVAIRPEVTMFLVASFYLGSSLIWNTWRLIKKQKERGVAIRRARRIRSRSTGGSSGPN